MKALVAALATLMPICASAAVLSGGTLSGGVLGGRDAENWLVVVVDDLSPHLVSAYADQFLSDPAPYDTMPTLDSLAASGVRFDAAWTTATPCSPSRAALETGRSSFRNGVSQVGGLYSTNEYTLPRAIEHGNPGVYRYLKLGKRGSTDGGLSPPPGDTNLNFTGRKGWDTTETIGLLSLPDYYSWTRDTSSGQWESASITIGSNSGTAYNPTDMMATASAWVQSLPAPQPFVVWVEFMATHSGNIHRPDIGGQDGAGCVGFPADGRPGSAPFTPNEECQSKILLEIDTAIGNFLASLTPRQRASTGVIFTADQGHISGRPYKGSGDSNQYRVPLIISSPYAGTAGASSTALVQTVDVWATIVARTGGSVPAVEDTDPSDARYNGATLHIDGRDLSSELGEPCTGGPWCFADSPRTLMMSVAGEGAQASPAMVTDGTHAFYWEGDSASEQFAALADESTLLLPMDPGDALLPTCNAMKTYAFAQWASEEDQPDPGPQTCRVTGGASVCTDGVDCPCDTIGAITAAGDNVLFCRDFQEDAWRNPLASNNPAAAPGGNPSYRGGGGISLTAFGISTGVIGWDDQEPGASFCESAGEPWACCTGPGTGPTCPENGAICDEVAAGGDCQAAVWATDDSANVDIYGCPSDPGAGSTRPTDATHYCQFGILQDGEIGLMTGGDVTSPSSPAYSTLNQFMFQHVPRGDAGAGQRDTMGHADGAQWGSRTHASRTQIIAWADNVEGTGIQSPAWKSDEMHPDGSPMWNFIASLIGLTPGFDWDRMPFAGRIFANCSNFTGHGSFASNFIDVGCNPDDNLDWRVQSAVYDRDTDAPFGNWICIEQEFITSGGTTTIRQWFTSAFTARTQVMDLSGPAAELDSGGSWSGMQFNAYANQNGTGAVTEATGRAYQIIVDTDGPPATCPELWYPSGAPPP